MPVVAVSKSHCELHSHNLLLVRLRPSMQDWEGMEPDARRVTPTFLARWEWELPPPTTFCWTARWMAIPVHNLRIGCRFRCFTFDI